MKKFSILCLILLFIYLLCGCSLLYSDKAELDGFDIYINETQNKCFVGYYKCIPDDIEISDMETNYEITVPNFYNGIPITELGGYYGRGVPCPFYISLAEYMNAEDGSKYSLVYSSNLVDYNFEEEYNVIEIPFTIYLGQNINSIINVSADDYFPHINDDGTITFYHAVVEIVCSEYNETFYSKEGKLYFSKDNTLVTEFDYK